MSALQGIRGQTYHERFFDASGTITTGGTAQLILSRAQMRSSLYIENLSANDMYIEFGPARATATLSSGTVNAVSVSNAGFGYSLPPTVRFIGGAYPGNILTPALTLTLPGDASWPSPPHPAKAHCVMSGSGSSKTVGSIVIDDPGAGYQYPPYVLLTNDQFDLFGCAVPSVGVGVLLKTGGAFNFNGSVCPTEAVSVFCATTSSAFMCKYTL